MILVLGGGPAGLTAAWELQRHGHSCTVLEREALVGGLSRTIEHNGFLFDIGGHRFYTSSALVESIWKEVLGDDLLTRKRLSRIYYRGRFFQYPLEAYNVIAGLGLKEVLHCAASYAWSHVTPYEEENFEAWVRNRFGRRLFEIFFRSYTEKVWGIPCSEISAEWAAQRIRGLNLWKVVAEALHLKLSQDGSTRSLIQEFYYPRRGPGMMWTKMAEGLRHGGSRVVTRMPVEEIFWEPGRILGVKAGGQHFEAGSFLSTLAIRDLISLLNPAPPDWLQVAGGLRYRDFVIVAVMIRGSNLFPDQWIYVHDPAVSVARIQNFNNWSPEMSPDPSITCLGVEYFCSEGDGLWATSDQELVNLARRELEYLKLSSGREVVDGVVLRIKKAYPVYDSAYREYQQMFRRFLEETPNLQVAGRNGLHRYNNQDHAMLSGIMAARNLLGGRYDVWSVNGDESYVEEAPPDNLAAEWVKIAADQPWVPER